LRAERDFLVAELAAAVGLGGRDRVAASAVERARQSVSKGVHAAIRRLGGANPALGRHLEATVRTGTYCIYQPDPRAPIRWEE
ncbi:MAG: transcriptional regulator, partial [Actinomycetota bacterium]|nr:transcriptional regulator [Actinomycetota bacterium]